MICYIALAAIVSSYCCICNAHPDDARQVVISKVIGKVCDIAKSSLSKASSPEEKNKIIEKIELKLLKQTGNNDKDKVKFIIQGVKAMSKDNDYSLCQQMVSKKLPLKKVIRNGNVTEMHQIEENTAKQNLLNEMAFKIEKLAKKSFQNTTTIEQKQQILDNIQKRLIETVKGKDRTSGGNRNKTDSYISLIMEGIKHVMEKTANDSRRMTIIEFHGKPETNQMETVDIYNHVDSQNQINIETTTSHDALRTLTTKMVCASIADRICSNLKSLNEFICTYDDTLIPLENVCDGSVACPDESDEKNCAVHAVERVHSATNIISSIDMNRECFAELISDKHLAAQEKLLSNLLEQQLDFIKKHGTNHSEMHETAGKIDCIVEVAAEALIVVRSFAIIVKAALCDVSDEEANHIVAAYDQILEKDFENTVLIGHWYPKSCICDGLFCKNATCPDPCKRLCFQRHTLWHWSCQTVDKKSSLSLDFVCDGKLDCFDESDEIGCATDSVSKFEASSIFGNVITALTVKSKSKEYQPVWNHLLVLQEAIKKIQELSMKPKVNFSTYKAARDKVFALLDSTYVEFLDHKRNLEIAEPVYKFLLYVNDKLVGALKRSQMGNEKVISDDECLCRGDKCATQLCSMKCIRICSATPVLTSYSCGSSNTSVTIDTICNGKEDCPNGEDEINCKKEICRVHHLKVLRHNIQKVGKKHEGTILGEVLDAWKTKVTSRLVIAEKRDRPTPGVVRNVVKNILSDLVRTYSSLEEIQKMFNAEGTIRKFRKLSQRIIETLKSCAM